jgi:RNA recognition motif-containing protein
LTKGNKLLVAMGDVKKNDNVPPNSRLFIVCGKTVTEEDFKETFGAFGQVEHVQIHKDRKGESKGIAYVKFSKTSEAAQAVEEMNGRCIGQHPRPLKVTIGL